MIIAFWKLNLHPITGFKPPRRNTQDKVDQAIRKKNGALYRAKKKLKLKK